jgi:hypothetical protein
MGKYRLLTGLMALNACLLFPQELSVNNFIYSRENNINPAHYTSITCAFGTFYTGIADRAPKLSLYGISGIDRDGNEQDLGYTIITIDIKRPLNPGQVEKLNYDFKDAFLKNGYLILEIDRDRVMVKAAESGETVDEYFEKNGFF